MATTGYWPVKGKLKQVIDYAKNPDKTTDPKYLDEDLKKVIQYAQNSKKTQQDKVMYVSAINCPKQRAYECMTATKRRYGKMGGNVAYHGYQSFSQGEVSPELAHKIGKETAKRMWGDEYEIVVTTHLNTDSTHNHFVVNSVSFKTGRKFENHISDHYKLREISDRVCKEFGLKTLEQSKFNGNHKKEHWIKKDGQLTHRDILKRDIDEAIRSSHNWDKFDRYLYALGYRYTRDVDYKHPSIIAPGWKRPVRIESLGKEYTMENIGKRIMENRKDMSVYYIPLPKKYTPLMSIEREVKKLNRMDGLQVTFLFVTELLKLMTGNNVRQTPVRPLSPEMRQEVRKLDKRMEQYKLLCDYHLNSPQELVSFISEKKQIFPSLKMKDRNYTTSAAEKITSKLKKTITGRQKKYPQR